MPVITISRQVGSGGEEIARRLCDTLDYRYLDKWLLKKVASEVGLSENEVIDFTEDHYKAHSLFERLFGPRPRVVANVSTRSRDTTGAENIARTALNEEQCIDLVRTAVVAAHKRGNIVIAGRGSQVILKDKFDALHIRIESPLPLRIQNISREENLSERDALSYIEDRDRAAAQYVERFFGARWDDPMLYHLVINTGKFSLDTSVATIVSAVRQLDEAPARAA